MIDSRMWRCVLLVPVLAAGCGGTHGASTASTATPSVRHLPPCARVGRAVRAPSTFPRSFPLPGGTVITSTSPLSGGTVISGAIPTESLAATATYIHSELPKRGYKNEQFEAEPPHDSEGQFRGHGYIGRWQIRSMGGCKGAVSFQAFARPLAK